MSSLRLFQSSSTGLGLRCARFNCFARPVERLCLPLPCPPSSHSLHSDTHSSSTWLQLHHHARPFCSSRAFSTHAVAHSSSSSSTFQPPFHPSPHSTPSPSTGNAPTPTPSTSSFSATPSSVSPSPRRSLRGVARAAVTLTPAALSRLRELIAIRASSPSSSSTPSSPVLGIRLGIKRKGCNGLSYTLNYVSPENLSSTKGDEIVESDDVKLFIDSRAVFFLIGTTMDYVDDDLRAEFVFQNPKEKGKCGCGESFTVE